MTDRTATADTQDQTGTAQPTRLSTVLTYLGMGEAARADMEARLRRLAARDSRIKVEEIMAGETGVPTCTVSFECTGYAPPVDGNPDPQAIRDLQRLLGDENLDGCLLWSTISFLVG